MVVFDDEVFSPPSLCGQHVMNLSNVRIHMHTFISISLSIYGYSCVRQRGDRRTNPSAPAPYTSYIYQMCSVRRLAVCGAQPTSVIYTY